jgi:hypothetical protein
MSLDHYVPLFSSAISFSGLMLVLWQLRINNRQRESESLARIIDVNRQLITLGFSHPELFAILEDKKVTNPVWERQYLTLWLNQLSLVHSFLKNSALSAERQINLERDMFDFMAMSSVQNHWQTHGKFYPASFQTYVNNILKKIGPPEAAQVSPS